MRLASSRATLGVAAGLGAVGGWAFYTLAGRQGLDDGFTAGQLGALRYLVPAVCLFPLLPIGLAARLREVGIWKLGALAALAGPLYGFVVMHGLTLAPVSHAVVLGPGLLMATALAAQWRETGRRPTSGQIAGAVLILLGAGVLSTGTTAATPIRDQLLGDVLFAASGVAMGLFTVLTRRWALKAVEALAGTALLGSALLIPLTPTIFANVAELGWQALAWQAAAQGLVGGLLALLAYVAAIRLLGSSRAAFFPGFVPGVTIAAAAMLGIEAWTLRAGAGVALATLGLVIAQASGLTSDPSERGPAHA